MVYSNLNLFPAASPAPRKISVIWQFLAKKECHLSKLVDKWVFYAMWVLQRISYMFTSMPCPGANISLKRFLASSWESRKWHLSPLRRPKSHHFYPDIYSPMTFNSNYKTESFFVSASWLCPSGQELTSSFHVLRAAGIWTCLERDGGTCPSDLIWITGHSREGKLEFSGNYGEWRSGLLVWTLSPEHRLNI